MSRPKPTVVLEHIHKTTYKIHQVLKSSGMWVVLYDGQPFNLKTSNYLKPDPGPKYKKTAFLNVGHAKNLAKKLNILFKTNKFKVHILTEGTPVD